MKFTFSHYSAKERTGTTLIEIILFVVLVSLMMGTILPLLFNATESRQRQDAIALVEHNGAQVIQTIVQEIRSAERILDPPIGDSGHILALQAESEEDNPTIIALHEGVIVLVKGRERRILSSDLVGVTGFSVDNTSTSEDRQSVVVSLDLRRIIRISNPLEYSSHFDTVVNLYPDDTVSESECDCITPFCDTVADMYTWQICHLGTCIPYADFECVYES